MQQELIESIRQDCRVSLADYTAQLEVLKDQVILITGGTGFMGKWLTEAITLLNDEHAFNIKLYLLSRNVKQFQEEVPHLTEQPFVNLIGQDIRNLASLPQDVTWVINAAGTPDSRQHVSIPLKSIDTFYKGTQAVLDACLRLPTLKKVVQISSNYVYGHSSNPVNFVKENQFELLNCNSVNATYAEGKRIAETVCAIYRNQQRLPIAIVRPFAFIGPYQGIDKPWAINNFIRDAILGGPIRILGNENTVRSYMYGSDMAFWLLMILAKAKTGAVYNIGGNEPISLRDLSKQITLEFTNKIEVLVRSSREFSQSPMVSVPDTSAIKADLFVKNTTPFSAALKKTIDWYVKTELH
jgi:nucleoside-diphosphate-sugar epimerase